MYQCHKPKLNPKGVGSGSFVNKTPSGEMRYANGMPVNGWICHIALGLSPEKSDRPKPV